MTLDVSVAAVSLLSKGPILFRNVTFGKTELGVIQWNISMCRTK